MGKWSIQEQENEFFLTIMGVRSIDPQTKQTYQKIEKIVCGRSADELVVNMQNTFFYQRPCEYNLSSVRRRLKPICNPSKTLR